MNDSRRGAATPRTLLEHMLRTGDHTLTEVAEQFRRLALEMGEPATLSPRHLRRLAAGERHGTTPTTRRVLRRLFGVDTAQLLAPYDPLPSGDTEPGPDAPWRPTESADAVPPACTDVTLPVAASDSMAGLCVDGETTPVLIPVIVDGRAVLVPLDPQALPTLFPSSVPGSGVEDAAAQAGALVKASPLAVDPGDLERLTAASRDPHRNLDASVVDAFRRQLTTCKADDGRLGPRHTLPAVLAILRAVEQHARDAGTELRGQLLSLGADAAEFTGWLYRDSHRPQQAGFWYDRAMEWAQAANDTAMQGYVLLRKSQKALDARDALHTAAFAHAAHDGPWQLPLKVRAEVTQQEALGLALLGEPIERIQRKLDAAEELLAGRTCADDDADRLGASYDEHTLRLRSAVCLTEAGRPQLGAEYFGAVLSSGTLSRRDEGYFRARRAAALALCGEPDGAAELGLDALIVARETSSQRTLRVLRDVVRTLAPWRTRPGPRALLEALAA